MVFTRSEIFPNRAASSFSEVNSTWSGLSDVIRFDLHLAGLEVHIFDIKTAELANPNAGIEQDENHGAITGGGRAADLIWFLPFFLNNPGNITIFEHLLNFILGERDDLFVVVLGHGDGCVRPTGGELFLRPFIKGANGFPVAMQRGGREGGAVGSGRGIVSTEVGEEAAQIILSDGFGWLAARYCANLLRADR